MDHQSSNPSNGSAKVRPSFVFSDSPQHVAAMHARVRKPLAIHRYYASVGGGSPVLPSSMQEDPFSTVRAMTFWESQFNASIVSGRFLTFALRKHYVGTPLNIHGDFTISFHYRSVSRSPMRGLFSALHARFANIPQTSSVERCQPPCHDCFGPLQISAQK